MAEVTYPALDEQALHDLAASGAGMEDVYRALVDMGLIIASGDNRYLPRWLLSADRDAAWWAQFGFPFTLAQMQATFPRTVPLYTGDDAKAVNDMILQVMGGVQTRRAQGEKNANPAMSDEAMRNFWAAHSDNPALLWQTLALQRNSIWFTGPPILGISSPEMLQTFVAGMAGQGVPASDRQYDVHVAAVSDAMQGAYETRNLHQLSADVLAQIVTHRPHVVERNPHVAHVSSAADASVRHAAQIAERTPHAHHTRWYALPSGLGPQGLPSLPGAGEPPVRPSWAPEQGPDPTGGQPLSPFNTSGTSQVASPGVAPITHLPLSPAGGGSGGDPGIIAPSQVPHKIPWMWIAGAAVLLAAAK